MRDPTPEVEVEALAPEPPVAAEPVAVTIPHQRGGWWSRLTAFIRR
ncbi:hypothetical protein ACFV4F_41885 [Kitasatospora sp. NPDC059722]